MLEFKNVRVSKDGRVPSAALSFIVRRGEMLYMRGGKGCGKSSLVGATMGFTPISEGYITIEGEPVTPASAATFRRLIAYVPQDLRLSEATPAALFDRVARLRINQKNSLSKDSLLAFWDAVNIDRTYYEMLFDTMDEATRRVLILSLAGILRRPLVLVDESLTATEDILLREMAQQGSAVLVTGCRETGEGMYDKQITLEI